MANHVRYPIQSAKGAAMGRHRAQNGKLGPDGPTPSGEGRSARAGMGKREESVRTVSSDQEGRAGVCVRQMRPARLRSEQSS
jgi:hypothetical protein